MRAAEELIETLTSLGVRLWEEEGGLRFSAPKGVLTPGLKGEMTVCRVELLALLRAAGEAAHPAVPPILPRLPGLTVPLSFAQQRLWFLDQLHPGNPAYNLAQAVQLRGPLDVQALQRAFAEIVRRHEILRTVFVAVDGELTQVVQGPGSVELTLEDLTTGGDDISHRREWVRHLLAKEARRPFDLARGPLVRARLVRLAGDEHLLAVVMHHAVSDGWSEAVLVNELTELYRSFSSSSSSLLDSPLPDLPIQFGDYAVWERQHASSAASVHREYWRSALAGAPTALDLVTDRPRMSTQTFAGDRVPFRIPERVSKRLVKLAADEATTPFAVILAAWAAVLGRYARQEDLIIGIPVANRDRRELEPLIGFLVNTLAVRIDLSGGPAVVELVRRVRRSMMEALEHQEVPFERVVEELRLPRDLSRPPLFQTMLAMVPSTPITPLRGLEWSPHAIDFPFARLDLTLFIRGGVEDGFTGELDFNTDLFDDTTAVRMSDHFLRMLDAMTAEPDRAIASIPLMDSAERRHLLVEWNRTETSPGTLWGCAHHLIEEQVRKTPGAVAVQSATAQLTYAQLDQAATGAAAALVADGVQPGVVVGVCLRRTPDLLVALLAIWKAGGAFLPLDPSFPDERLDFMVEDAGASLVIVDGEGKRTVGRTVTVDQLASAGKGSFPPEAPVSPESLAYVMYTSGSSGRPKGVMIPHRGLVNYLEWCCGAFPVHEGVGAPVYTSVGFDATLTSLLVPLVAGGTVCLLPEGDELEALAEELRSPRRYSFVKVTPAHLEVLSALVGEDIHPDSTGCVIIGGEALLGRHLTAWRDRLPGARFINEYGPTETVVGCCVHELAPGEAVPKGRVPIGRPIANTRLFVLDDAQVPVPVGVSGELWVAGAGVGLGYVNRPSLSDEKFPSPRFPEAEGARAYRTGDMVRHLADGTLEYLGRIDEQINLNGFRIEAGEVEAALGEHEGVGECIVLTREGAGGGRRRLVAYYTRPPGVDTSEKELLLWLRQRLPEFMVPTSLVALEGMPLTANGKVDRAALPAPAQVRTAADHVPPSNPAEQTMVEIWEAVLGADRIGIHDNFFDLGGDSILSIQVVARAARRGLVLSPRLLFQHQTISELAALAQRSASTGREPQRASEPVPLTPIQRWFFHRCLVETHHYNQAVLLETSPGTNPVWLQAAFETVVAHHDVFRHRFIRHGDEWQQRLAEEGREVPFQTLDLSRLAVSSRASAITAEVDRLQGSLDLAGGPVVRGLFMDCGGDNGRLAIVAHHLVIDGVSWRILLDDLAHCYKDIAHGREPELPPATTSFAAWADELVSVAAGELCARDMETWQGVVRSDSGSLPVDHPGAGAANTVESADSIAVEFTADETIRLLDSAPRHHQATVNELLLSALGRALAGWCDGTNLLIDLEGHGREPLEGSLDVSRTVGWFTALFPLRLPFGRQTDPSTQVGAVKRCVREIPSKGATYGILRYLHPAGESLIPPPGQHPQLSWNYLGRWHATGDDSLFPGLAAESVGGLVSPRQARSHLLEIQAVVLDDRLRVEWGFSAAFHERSTIAGLSERFCASLRALLPVGSTAGGPTPGPLAGLDEDQLEKLSGIIGGIDEGADEGPDEGQA